MRTQPLRVLLVILSEETEGEGGSLPLGGFASAYYELRDASIELTLASRMGGYLFLDHSDMSAPHDVGAARRFQADRSARDDLADTIRVDDVDPADFDGAMCLASSSGGMARQLPERVCFLVSCLLSFGKPVVVIPATLAPSTDNGLLITGSWSASACQAANALIGVLKAMTTREDTGP